MSPPLFGATTKCGAALITSFLQNVAVWHFIGAQRCVINVLVQGH